MNESRVRVATVAILTMAIVTACGGDGPSGPKAYKDPTGTYTVATFNGKTLPAPMYADTNYLYELTSGSASLTSDGKYVSVLNFRQTLPGSVSLFVDTVRGTWALSGTTVSFTNSLDSTATDAATWSNVGKLTFIEPHSGGGNDTLVYGRQP
jgi:hypothetical protein